MKWPSVSEIVSVLQIVIAILCLPAILLFSMVITFPYDMKLFTYQCSLSTTMVLCLIFGFSTWFYNSHYPKTRFHVRVLIAGILWILFIFGVVTAVLFDLQFSKDLIYGVFDPDLFDSRDYAILYFGMGLGALAHLLLLIVSIILTVSVCRCSCALRSTFSN
ncbi:uncharacterized protein LOC129238725 [Anastrepha obliqua]|uniref:uncharacterized protein LOC129238725 n=1 Tax=Anastrepha obliqua TaxID=95512 RepID=UPI002409C3B8|nr:uncharacterized protein LOC129238725 [Anastrepha obliqua]